MVFHFFIGLQQNQFMIIYSIALQSQNSAIIKTMNDDSVSYGIASYDAGKSGINLSCTKRVIGNGIDYIYRDLESGRKVVSNNDSIYLIIDVDLQESQSVDGEYELQVTIGTKIDTLFPGETRLIELTVKKSCV